MIEIKKRYIRTSKKVDESIVVIKDEKDQAYHADLETQGFIYKEVKPTIARGSICESCEG